MSPRCLNACSRKIGRSIVRVGSSWSLGRTYSLATIQNARVLNTRFIVRTFMSHPVLCFMEKVYAYQVKQTGDSASLRRLCALFGRSEWNGEYKANHLDSTYNPGCHEPGIHSRCGSSGARNDSAGFSVSRE